MVISKNLFRKQLFIAIYLIFFAILCTFSDCTYLKSKKVDCVKQISHEIKSIEINSDYSDLMFLKKILFQDSVRIVLLGEQNHYDGTSFIAKLKLIRFLHEEMGFEVLAFESGLYDCEKGWEIVEHFGDYELGLKSSIFGLWAYSIEFKPVIQYLQSTLGTNSPIILTGIDNQLTGSVSKDSLLKDLDRLGVIPKELIKHSKFSDILSSLYFDSHDTLDFIKTDLVKLNYINQVFDKILENLKKSSTESDSNYKLKINYWLTIIEGLKTSYNSKVRFYNSNFNDSMRNFQINGPISNIRDAQMGKNLIWLCERKYPDKKFIVWSTNFHIMRNYSSVKFPENMMNLTKGTTTLGDAIWNKYGKKVYSITMTDYQSFVSKTEDKKAVEISLHRAGYDYAFINLKDTNYINCLGNEFTCRLLGHQELKGNWNSSTDGIFFINEIKKSNFKQ